MERWRDALDLAVQLWLDANPDEDYWEGGRLHPFVDAADRAFRVGFNERYPLTWRPSFDDELAILTRGCIPHEGACVVYTHVGPDNAALYVGSSQRFRKRQQQHKSMATARWLELERIDVEVQPTYFDMIRREKLLIGSLRPRDNKAGVK